MSERHCTAFGPASVANLGAGFDILGFALASVGDLVKATTTQKPGVSIEVDHPDLPTDPEKNTASAAVLAFLKDLGDPFGVHLDLNKRLPLGSGMGSSAASSVAALLAVNSFLEWPKDPIDLIPYAMIGEKIACGTAHSDNVAPSMLGGVVLIRSTDPLDIIPIEVSPELYCAVVHPHVKVNTEDARKILPKEIPLEKATAQWGNVAGLMTGLIKSDFGLISRSLEDRIVTPERSLLIPEYNKAREAALAAGALGFGISGSGPSVFALVNGIESCNGVASSILDAFDNAGIESDCYLSPLQSEGARIVDRGS